MQPMKLFFSSHRSVLVFACTATAFTLVILAATLYGLRPLPGSLVPEVCRSLRPRLVDRQGAPLTVTYRNPWNCHDGMPLHEMPDLLQQAFILSEDQRFREHGGVDWPARFHAALQNLRALKTIRGASTITEQVVRMLHPRPRTLWARWLETIEAVQLEKAFSKAEILEFYLNQVPYASRRRGVVQAARLYFDRDLDTLNVRECLALAVLVRAPTGLDLRRKPHALDGRIQQLAGRMLVRSLLSQEQVLDAGKTEQWAFGRYALPVEATQFVEYVYRHAGRRSFDSEETQALQSSSVLTTTLDSSLQDRVQHILDARLADLKEHRVRHGAALVIDNRTAEVLAWVNGDSQRRAEGADVPKIASQPAEVGRPTESRSPGDMVGAASEVIPAEAGVQVPQDFQGPRHEDAVKPAMSRAPASWIDAVTTPRQPGSTLKPFLYALAMERGMTAATLIDDSSLAHAVSSGLHTVHNYSHTHYGLLRLREALGNSLNVPAVRTIRFVSVEAFLERLHALGFRSLSRPAAFYGEGLALGDGEVTLFELVQAYGALARGGESLPLRFLGTPSGIPPARGGQRGGDDYFRRVMSEEEASLIADILSDPQARRLEFGDGQILRLPVQTAVKTGTSSDHRDAWAVGFSSRYTVGVWMGNLDRLPTDGVTGTTGPGLVLRAVFAELHRNVESEPLFLSPRLVAAAICRTSGLLASANCPAMPERFRPESVPVAVCSTHLGTGTAFSPTLKKEKGRSGGKAPRDAGPSAGNEPIALVQPTPGLNLAMDPRIPDDQEFFSILLPRHLPVVRIEWIIDGSTEAVTGPGELSYLWKVSRGTHAAMARVWEKGASEPVETPAVEYVVR